MSFCQIAPGSATKKAISFLLVATVLAMTACSEVIRSHGYTPSQVDLDLLEVGVDTEETVATAIGTPAFSSSTEEREWYYLSSTVREYAYRHPEIIDRQLVAVSFSGDGTVRNVERFGLEDGRVIALNRRVTDVAVKSPGLIRQLLGSIGNITSDDLADGP